MKRVLALIILLGLAGCENLERVQDHFRDMTPHEAYQESLKEAGLATISSIITVPRTGLDYP